jgi:hypothetical protein
MPAYWYSQPLLWHMVLQKWASIQGPLTSLTSSKFKFEWYSFHQQVFDKIKKAIGTEVPLFYPDLNKWIPFHLDIDASDHHLWQSSCRIKSLYPFIRESSIQLKSSIQPLKDTESCYQLLKLARNTGISC